MESIQNLYQIVKMVPAAVPFLGDGREAEVNLQIVYPYTPPMLSRMSGGVVDVNRVHKGWN